jgi:GTP-binding protein HflX
VDKREIGRRIAKLKDDLDQVRRHRSLHRAQRRKSGIPVVAIVGYTNAGKSTLLNALSEANVYVADQLFATLDPTTRRINLESGREILLTDTVGFIQKLPTTLIAAFRATLEEIVEADMILHVIDASSPHRESNYEAVEDTLAEIDIPRVPQILVWNKIDAMTDSNLPSFADQKKFSAQVKVSAVTREGLEELLNTIEQVLASQMQHVRFLLPFERGDVVSQLYQTANVLSQEATEKGTLLEVNVTQEVRDRYRNFEYQGNLKREVISEEN